jgi:rod shape-determining protein MreD
MKLIWYSLIVLLFVPVQSLLMASISLNGVQPDLGVILLYFIGLVYGEMDGILFGLIIGFLMDLFSGGPLGANLVSKTLLGWASGMIGRTLLNVNAFFTLGSVFGLSLLNGILSFLFVFLIAGGWGFWASVRWVIVPEAFYDAVLATVLFLLASRSIETARLKSQGFSLP